MRRVSCWRFNASRTGGTSKPRRLPSTVDPSLAAPQYLKACVLKRCSQTPSGLPSCGHQQLMRFCPQIASAVDLIAILPYYQAASKETSIKASLQPAQPKARSCWQQVSKQLMRGHSVERKHPVKLDQNSPQLRKEVTCSWCICWHSFVGISLALRGKMEPRAGCVGEPAAFRGFRPNIGSYLPNSIYSRLKDEGSLAGIQ